MSCRWVVGTGTTAALEPYESAARPLSDYLLLPTIICYDSVINYRTRTNPAFEFGIAVFYLHFQSSKAIASILCIIIPDFDLTDLLLSNRSKVTSFEDSYDSIFLIKRRSKALSKTSKSTKNCQPTEQRASVLSVSAQSCYRARSATSIVC